MKLFFFAFFIYFVVMSSASVLADFRPGVLNCVDSHYCFTGGGGDVISPRLDIDRNSADIPLLTTIPYFTNRAIRSPKSSAHLREADKIFTSEFSKIVTVGHIDFHKFSRRIKGSIKANFNFYPSGGILKNLSNFKNRCSEKKTYCTLFIHGVNNSFSSALDSTFQLTQKVEGIVPFVYSWPTRKWGLVTKSSDYEYDKSMSNRASKDLELVNSLMQSAEFGVLAHSRGVHLLFQYLSKLSAELTNKYSLVTVIAPDSDSDFIKRVAKGTRLFTDLPVQIYINLKDKALLVSEWWNNEKRLFGGIDSEEMSILALDNANSFLNHNFHLSSFGFVRDFKDSLSGTHPEDRGSLVKQGAGYYLVVDGVR